MVASTFGAAPLCPMREPRLLFLLPLIMAAHAALAQPANEDCNSAVNLCSQQPQPGNNTGAVGWPGFCPGSANVLWYSFITNSQGGPVNVNVSGINCDTTLGRDNELSVVVLNGDGSCTPGSFNAASSCREDSVDFTLTTPALAPNTQYWVIVAGAANNGANPANCGFNVATGGPGANIVGVDFYAGPDVILSEGGNTQLLATGGTTYEWSPTSGLSSNTSAAPNARPNETTIYTVTTQINGCTYSDDVLVEVRRLIDPPNTITPNGDGKNDTWVIYGISDYPQADVNIYDRWGQRVYHSVGYKEPFSGGGLPTATYYWVIQLNKLEGQTTPYTGFLTLVN